MSRDDVGVVQRLIAATRYSVNGLKYAWSSQAPFRYEVYVLIVALPAAWFLGKGAVERGLMIGSVLQVIVVELVNSAIEATVDRIGPEHHVLSGRAKDMGSAAVFCSGVLAATVWLTLLLS